MNTYAPRHRGRRTASRGRLGEAQVVAERALADVTPELGEPDVDDEHVQCVMSAEAAKIVTGSCR